LSLKWGIMVSAETKTRLITAVKWVPLVNAIVLYSPFLWGCFTCFIVVGALMEYRRFMHYVWPNLQGFGSEEKDSSGSSGTYLEKIHVGIFGHF